MKRSIKIVLRPSKTYECGGGGQLDALNILHYTKCVTASQAGIQIGKVGR